MSLLVSIVSGLCWGILGSLSTQSLFGPFAWFAAPLGVPIGLLVYWMSRRFYSKSLWVLLPVAVIFTFGAVALFGLCLGVVDLSRDAPNRIAWAVIVESMNACLWGLIFIPIYWLLFPLSFGNHALIRYFTRRAKAE